MPKATKNHGDCLLAVKKVLVVAPLEVILATTINSAKYPAIKPITKPGLMKFQSLLKFQYH